MKFSTFLFAMITLAVSIGFAAIRLERLLSTVGQVRSKAKN